MIFSCKSGRFFVADRFGGGEAALESPAMFGPILSVLLMGMVPVWGAQEHMQALSQTIQVAPPASSAGNLKLDALDESLSASGAIIVDLESGQTVYAMNHAVPRPMASLTKLMTALIIVENHALDELVTVPADIGEVEGNKAYLSPGEKFTVGDLLSALLIMSGNDAAVTLAVHHSGSTTAFAREMNERAEMLGLKETSYQNPAGFDATIQRSSPRDLAWLAMFVMRDPAIAERMSTSFQQITGSRGSVIPLTHTHELLRSDDEEILAGKTGTTPSAGQCLLSIVSMHGKQYVTVLLHSSDRYADMRKMLASLTN